MAMYGKSAAKKKSTTTMPATSNKGGAVRGKDRAAQVKKMAAARKKAK